MPSIYRTIPPLKTTTTSSSGSGNSVTVDLTAQVNGTNQNFILVEPLPEGVSFLAHNGVVNSENTNYIISLDRQSVQTLFVPSVGDDIVIFII
jgi:hypothetical protein